MVAYCVTIIVIVLLFMIILEYNICVRLRNKVKQAESSIDVYLNQRFDLIPNLVECVKGYKIYEERLLTKLVEKRNIYKDNPNLKEATDLNSEMLSLVGVAEGYPSIKANEQFLKLQEALTRMESQLQAARRIYNGDVTVYNIKITSFPTNIIAKIFNFREEDLFEIEEYKKELKIDFKG